MTTETKEQTITFDGVEYKISDLTPDQITLVNHCIDVEQKIKQAQFQLQQLEITYNSVITLLRNALKGDPDDTISPTQI